MTGLGARRSSGTPRAAHCQNKYLYHGETANWLI